MSQSELTFISENNCTCLGWIKERTLIVVEALLFDLDLVGMLKPLKLEMEAMIKRHLGSTLLLE